jgi:ferredoxin
MDRKKKKPMNCVPVIDMHECSDCGTCLDLCPSVFKRNEEAGFIEVMEFPCYHQEDIHEAISCCPKDCIALEEIIA